MFKVTFLSAIIALAILYKFSDAQSTPININEISEPCGKPFVTEDFDSNWETASGVNENTTLYFPFLSKLDAYRLTQGLFESTEFESISESQLINSCLTVRRGANGKTYTMYGYNGKKFVKYLNPIVPKVFSFARNYPDGVGGEVSVILSDNESYNLFNICYEDGTRSFGVISRTPTLAEGTLNTIKAHLKSLGFQEKNFLTLDFSNCIESNGFLLSNENIVQVPKPKPTERQYLKLVHHPHYLFPQNIGQQYVIIPGHY